VFDVILALSSSQLPATNNPGRAALPHRLELALLVVNNARQIFNCQRSDFFGVAEDVENQLPVLVTGNSPSTSSYLLDWIVLLGSAAI
jgi:hypothetical protein